MKKGVLLLVGLFVFVAVYGCTGTNRVVKRINVIEPPTYKIDSPVAIMPFTGDERWARPVTAAFEEAMTTARVNGKPFYTVVERARIRQILDEIILGQQGIIDDSTAAQAGRMLGAKTVIFGSVTEAAAEDTGIRESRSECLKWKKKRSDLERLLGLGCVKSRKYYIPCVIRSGRFAVAFKVVDVETGTVRFSDQLYGKTKEWKMCNEKSRISQREDEIDIIRGVLFGGGGGSLPSKDQVIRIAMSGALDGVGRSIAPYVHPVDITFKGPDDHSPEWVQKRIENGLEWVKNNRADRACEMWQEAYSRCNDSVSLLYNLGVCKEISGDLQGALEMYRKADRMLSNPDPDVSDGIIRVKRRLRNQQVLQGMM